MQKNEGLTKLTEISLVTQFHLKCSGKQIGLGVAELEENNNGKCGHHNCWIWKLVWTDELWLERSNINYLLVAYNAILQGSELLQS